MATRRNDYRIQVYLRPREYMIHVAETNMMLRTESEHTAEIIKAHQRGMTDTNHKMLIEKYHELENKKTEIKK